MGGGFVVNSATQVAENLYYMGVDKDEVPLSRREMAGTHYDHAESAMIAGPGEPSDEAQAKAQALAKEPPFLFKTAAELHKICADNNMTIAQVVWENERAFRSEDEIRSGLLKRMWSRLHASISLNAQTMGETGEGRDVQVWWE